MTLTVGSYEVSGDQILWFIAPKTAPAIIVTGCDLPDDNKKAIVVEGLCEGITQDGRQRTYGVDYYVTVNCSPSSAAASGPHGFRSE